MKNTVLLIGRITKDLELRSTKSGTEAVKFTIAVPRDYKNADGIYESDFVGIIAYKQMAKYLCDYAQKGDLVGVKGKIVTGSYEKEDKKVYTQDIVAERISLLSSVTKKDNDKKDDNVVSKNNEQDPFEEFGDSINMTDISEEDLPF